MITKASSNHPNQESLLGPHKEKLTRTLSTKMLDLALLLDPSPLRHTPSPSRPGPSSSPRHHRIPSPIAQLDCLTLLLHLQGRIGSASPSLINANEIMRLPESERPGFEQQPLLDLGTYPDVPEELIETQPEWRRVHMRSVRVYNDIMKPHGTYAFSRNSTQGR